MSADNIRPAIRARRGSAGVSADAGVEVVRDVGPVATEVRLEAELTSIASMTMAELRLRWGQLCTSKPPPAYGPDLLRRALADRLQQQALGGLAAPAEAALNRLVGKVAASADCRLANPRRINPGAVMTRQWRGVTHQVVVVEGGFAWQGRTFASLSEIARLITGTRWNGPRFFGLRAGAKDKPGFLPAVNPPGRIAASQLSLPKPTHRQSVVARLPKVSRREAAPGG